MFWSGGDEFRFPYRVISDQKEKHWSIRRHENTETVTISTELMYLG